MEHVQWSQPRLPLRTPVMIAAFTGWNDAGDAASTAVRHMIETWRGRLVATIDAEAFFDFQSSRPQVRLTEGLTREIVWPTTDVYVASTGGGDLLLVEGSEPQLKWRTFCEQVLGVAQACEVGLVITLGALLADVSHARPVPLIGTASDDALIDRFGLQRSRYEGPTGIVGVLQQAGTAAGIPGVSLWAAVPAYAPGNVSPKAALALLRRVSGMVGAPIDTARLEQAAVAYVAEVGELVDEDEDLAGYVRNLEAMIDDEDDDDDSGESGGIGEHDAGSGERLVEEVERFLRDHGPSDG
jgi:proteasome assembly chaperone (PAC2) family protein